jgi:phage-related tail fiber protein
VDGKKSIDEILVAMGGMGVKREDIDYLVEQGFLAISPQAGGSAATVAQASASPASPASAAVPPATDSLPAAAPAVSDRTPQQRYQDAKPIATKLSASLGLRGFMLNLSVESAAGYEDLVKLLPKLQDALGTKACRELEQALKG